MKAPKEARLFQCPKIKVELLKLFNRSWGFISVMFFNGTVLKANYKLYSMKAFAMLLGNRFESCCWKFGKPGFTEQR